MKDKPKTRLTLGVLDGNEMIKLLPYLESDDNKYDINASKTDPADHKLLRYKVTIAGIGEVTPFDAIPREHNFKGVVLEFQYPKTELADIQAVYRSIGKDAVK
ncbi:MAG: hypothetical protein NT129_04255 [Candidatus Aenigmarchaeota archaeon]|nr:hypothetical protein [Candidatus Aenigmarchaeota archaeon]